MLGSHDRLADLEMAHSVPLVHSDERKEPVKRVVTDGTE